MTITDAVNNSSGSLIVQHLIDLSKTDFPLLYNFQNNLFYEDTITKVKNFDSTNNRDYKELCEYIAASALIHTFDGWNYISRGVASILQNDFPTAIHLLYYSEVRSVMSIMAMHGIGIFNNKHWFLDNNGNFQHVIDTPTHHAISDSIKCFESGNNDKINTFFKCINLRNTNLENFFTDSGLDPALSISSQKFQNFFKEWSIDLQLQDDRKERNEASYRPNFQRLHKSSGFVDEVIKIWKELEPSESTPFQLIDEYLALSTIKALSRYKKKKVRPLIQNYFHNQGLKEPLVISEFLNGNSISKPFIFRYAEKDMKNKKLNLRNPLPMLCRAILLARLATGLVNSVLRDPGFVKHGINLWWRKTSVDIGLIAKKNAVTNSLDLWSDIDFVINELEKDNIKLKPARERNQTYGTEVIVLSQFQRAAFWGLGL